MSLAPQNRVLLTESLRPPTGYRVETAVATTYSLDLTSLLLAPLSFALFDEVGADPLNASDPIRVLEAVRRHAEHTTVFCQAGAIHIPGNYRPILTFIEDSVIQVAPHSPNALFHPKVWAVRFVNDHAERVHRLIVLSRNLTLDRSWDTALVLDEADAGTISGEPAANFIRQLPSLASQVSGVPRARREQAMSLAASLQTVSFSPPHPFTGGRLLPIGVGGTEGAWPFPTSAHRLVAISPFLTRDRVDALARLTNDRIVVSRAESFDLLGADALRGWRAATLPHSSQVDSDAETVSDQTAGGTRVNASSEAAVFSSDDSGLHAKTSVLDVAYRRSMMVTGSANLTGPAWATNVEFDVVLEGPTSTCGVEAMLSGTAEDLGLDQLLEDYAPSSSEGVQDDSIATSYEVERFHRALAQGQPELEISAGQDDDTITAELTLTLPRHIPGASRAWLVSVNQNGGARPLAASLTWQLARELVTPFIAVETTAGQGSARVTRRCLLKARLAGILTDRRREALLSLLTSKMDVLRYLVFLLGDSSYEGLFAQWTDSTASGGPYGAFGQSDAHLSVALMEPLVRAAGSNDLALGRVARLIDDLRASPAGADRVPEGFDELWNVVWQAHRSMLAESARTDATEPAQ